MELNRFLSAVSRQLYNTPDHHFYIRFLGVQHLLHNPELGVLGGTVASWLVPLSPDRAVRVRSLAWDTVLCSWPKHLTLTVPLFTQV